MAKGAASYEQPDDPDPTPTVSTETTEQTQDAKRNAKKRAASNYGRNQTILAGNTAQDNGAKKTILGG